jgi:hypothetical protein
MTDEDLPVITQPPEPDDEDEQEAWGPDWGET